MDKYQAIEDGLKNRERFLEYLQTIDLDSGRCIGAEALSRWRRSSGIVVQPKNVFERIE